MKDSTDVLLIMSLETQPQEIFSLLLRVSPIKPYFWTLNFGRFSAIDLFQVLNLKLCEKRIVVNCIVTCTCIHVCNETKQNISFQFTDERKFQEIIQCSISSSYPQIKESSLLKIIALLCDNALTPPHSICVCYQ